MSLFGAKRSITSLKDSLKQAKENLDARMAEESSSGAPSKSSGIGEQLRIARDLEDPDRTATTSEIAREDVGEFLGKEQPKAVVLPREVYNMGVRIHNAEVRAAGHPSQIMEPVFGTALCEEYGVRKSQKHDVQPISSDTSSVLLSPPATDYGGSDIPFPSQTPVQRVPTPCPMTSYGGSVVAMPLSALPTDPFTTPRASAGIIA